jgi:hypothetical protein
VAQFSLGSILEAGADTVAKDDAHAAAWYQKAATQGLASAQYRLGVLYAEGRGVARDLGQAGAWYRRAADQDDSDAQTSLGILLTPSEHAPGDIIEAHKWLNLAASRGTHAARRARAATLRDALATRMTPEERVEAQRRSIEWHDTEGVQRR